MVLGKLIAELSDATGAGMAAPLPLSVVIWVGVAELSVTVMVAL